MNTKTEPASFSSTKICLLDHDLKTAIDSASSHSLTFARAFLESLAISTEVWANRLCDLDHPAVKRVFKLSQGKINALASRGSWPAIRRLNNIGMLFLANLSYFACLWRFRSCVGNKILFVSNASPFVLPALQLFGYLKPEAKIAAYFQRPVTRAVRFVGTINRILRLQNIRYCTEVPRMAEAYSAALGLTCHALPFPRPKRSHVSSVPSAIPPIGLVLGSPQLAKGFDVFVNCLAHLTSHLEQGRVQIIVQSAPLKSGPLQRYLARLSEFAKSYPAVQLLPEGLTPQEYDDVLSKSDFVILPYRRASYAQQSSGIVVEALVYGKPVVVTEELSFSSLVADHRLGIEVADGDAVGLAQGIVRLVDDLHSFKIRAMQAAEVIKEAHSIEALSRNLISLFLATSANAQSEGATPVVRG